MDIYFREARGVRGTNRADSYLRGVKGISASLNAVAAICLTTIMLLTTTDVVLRTLGTPIVGTYELVGFLGGVIIGLAIPMTSWDRGHIHVDFLIQRLSVRRRKAANASTRLIAIAFFAIAGVNLFRQGVYLYLTREVSPTLQLPFYPVVFGIGLACVVECLVLIADIVKISRGKYE